MKGKRKNYNKWIHHRSYKYTLKGYSTACGKTSERIPHSRDVNEVTCPRCLEEMKKVMYFCNEHGFIDGIEVTYDEKCDYCGDDVSIN
jgi:rRNA maturation protein Nop10